MSFFKDSKRRQLTGLVKEFNEIDFENEKIEFSEELSRKYNKSRTIIKWWKEHYNLCATDERYLNATVTDIYEDYLTVTLRSLDDHYYKTPDNLPETREELLEIIKKECDEIRSQKENYATPEFIKEVDEERNRLMKAYEQERSMMSDPDKRRWDEIKIRRLHSGRMEDIIKKKKKDKKKEDNGR
jgi:hypothetical protein